jgi:pullulanase
MQCSFRCFAPTADAVHVVLYDEATSNKGRRLMPMRRIPEGCWKAIVCGDLKGKYYKLRADGADKLLFPGVEVLDPYSRCNTSHAGRSLIFGFETTPVAPRPCVKPEHTIVYELHIRDATIDPASGVTAQNRGKFLGLTETGTRLVRNESGHIDEERVPTCLDHIIQMGVTAVQLLPVQDFDNDETDDTQYKHVWILH